MWRICSSPAPRSWTGRPPTATLCATVDRHWRVLLSHLVLFGFIFPTERSRIPRAVLDRLLGRLAEEMASPPPTDKVCNGTLLSWQEYLIDLSDGGFRDARLAPEGPMTASQIKLWTERPK